MSVTPLNPHSDLRLLGPQVLELMGTSSDARSVENELVLVLGFEQFELIKELLKNRLKVGVLHDLGPAWGIVWVAQGSLS